MRRFLYPSLCLLAMSVPVQGQSVKLPAEIKADRGAWIAITPEIDGGPPQWRVDPGLSEVDLVKTLGAEAAAKVKGKVFTAVSDGRYRVEVWCAKGDKASEIAQTFVIVGAGKPAVVVGPEQIPMPKPAAAPIPGPGFKVLIVEETKKRTPAQRIILLSQILHKFLDANAAVGPDGKTPEWRMLDKDANLANAPKIWQDAMARPRGDLPWIIISNGTTGVERKLPDTLEETLDLLKKVRDNVDVPSVLPTPSSDLAARIAWWQQHHPEFLTKP
jgi:hypothetical protein